MELRAMTAIFLRASSLFSERLASSVHLVAEVISAKHRFCASHQMSAVGAGSA
jgi:hypothetical protein